MTAKSLEDLEFAKVQAMIFAFTLSDEGRAFLQDLSFASDTETLTERQEYISTLLGFFEQDGIPELYSFPSIEELMTELENPSPSLDGIQLLTLAQYITRSEALFTYFLQEPTKPLRFLIASEVADELRSIQRAIFDTLDDGGLVKETHPRLRPLFKQLEATRHRRSSYCSTFIQDHRAFVQSDIEALRDGRLVIPIKDGHKHNVKGYISSVSATGQTVFMEPFALVDLNNSVLLAQNQITVEIAKIIGELTALVKAQYDLLLHLQQQIGSADGYYAIARWAHESRATRVEHSDGRVRLINARHPLLKSKAIPITIEIPQSIKAVVLSGPNAGGKTVTVKTFGLFAVLNQYCGYVPVSEGSALPLYDAIYTDIGDEQSIEKELSTFSGHMGQIASILNNLCKNSLVILDELGSGTDPLEGSALAQAILSYAVQHSALTLVTSHHGVIKEFAYSRADMINAAMEFDEKSGRPTFTIIPNVIGSSHALATAKAMGLPSEVIAEAEELLGSDRIEITTVLKRLEEERQAVEKRLGDVKKKEKAAQDAQRYVDLQRLQLKQKEHQLKNDEVRSLSRFTKKARQTLEGLVTELRTGEITSEKTKAVKSYLTELDERIEREERVLEEEPIFEHPKTFEIGMDVLCGPSKREGTILSKEGKNSYLVAIGSMRMKLKASELYLPKAKEKEIRISYTAERRRAKGELDVRGFTLEEALEAVEQNIEAAILNNISTFGIIHGYGDGILSKGIGQYLRTHRSVSDYRFALPEDGGMGKTYVFL